MEKDPVCGMYVNPETAANSFKYKGTVHYFCATGCKIAFEKDPEKYLDQSGAGHGHHG